MTVLGALALLVAAFMLAAKAAEVRTAARLRLLAVPLDARPSSTGIVRVGGRVLSGRPPSVIRAGLALLGAILGARLAGTAAMVAGAGAGLWVPTAWRHRRERRDAEILERQVGEIVDGCALAVRGGFSVTQALDFAAEDARPPMAGLVETMAAEQRLGAPFEAALSRFGDRIGTDDARLFVLVMSIHHRSGGNVAGALEEVAATIRHRIGVRRELRALTAQGRISGTVLGTLPIGFFLVLAATSHRDLAPVYRSGPGMAMVVAGFVLEGLAYVWIRHLLRVEL